MTSQQEPQPPAQPSDSPPPASREPSGAVEPPAAPPATGTEPTAVPDQSPPRPSQIPRTRIGTIWIGIGAAAVIVVALIVFLLQNTATVEVAFLNLEGSLPLAVALLIAWVAGVLLTLVVGTARIAQLRRLDRKRHRDTGTVA